MINLTPSSISKLRCNRDRSTPSRTIWVEKRPPTLTTRCQGTLAELYGSPEAEHDEELKEEEEPDEEPDEALEEELDEELDEEDPEETLNEDEESALSAQPTPWAESRFSSISDI